MLGFLDGPLARLGPQQRTWVLDATAVAAYHAEVGFPVVKLLVSDDAPPFTWLTSELALCWVHEARHYNKLLPYFAPHVKLLDAWGIFQTLAATATKSRMTFYAYVHDRVSKANRMPGLDTVIAARANKLKLGTSWAAP